MNTKQNKLQGSLLIIGSGFFFSLMSLMVRLSGDVPVMQKVVFRNLVASFVSLVLLIKSGNGIYVKKGNRWMIAARCVAGTIGMIANFYAIDKIGLADSNMLNKLAPFFATAFSVFLLKERAKKIEWAAIGVAFAGVLLVIKPSFHMTTVYSMVGVISGLFAGLAFTCVRWLGKHGEYGPVIVFYFSIFSVLLCLPFVILNYHPMTSMQWAYLLLAGVFAGGGQLCATAAYTKAPAKDISVFDYAQILFAAIWGITFLNEVPDIFSFIGYIIIIGVAVIKWNYTKKER